MISNFASAEPGTNLPANRVLRAQSEQGGCPAEEHRLYSGGFLHHQCHVTCVRHEWHLFLVSEATEKEAGGWPQYLEKRGKKCDLFSSLLHFAFDLICNLSSTTAAGGYHSHNILCVRREEGVCLSDDQPSLHSYLKLTAPGGCPPDHESQLPAAGEGSPAGDKK